MFNTYIYLFGLCVFDSACVLCFLKSWDMSVVKFVLTALDMSWAVLCIWLISEGQSNKDSIDIRAKKTPKVIQSVNVENRNHFSPAERPAPAPVLEAKRDKSPPDSEIEKPQILMSEQEFRAYLREHLDSDKGEFLRVCWFEFLMLGWCMIWKKILDHKIKWWVINMDKQNLNYSDQALAG